MKQVKGHPAASLTAEQRELMASLLEAEGIEWKRPPQIGRRGSGERIPLSFAQQRLWLLDQLNPGSNAYNVPTAFHLKGKLDLAAFRASFNEIVSRHEVLRTAFPATAGEPYQTISAAAFLPLPLVDLSQLAEPDRQRQALELITTAAQQPFDLAQSPLLRVMVVRLSEQEHYWSLVLHHIVSDAWSLSLLLRELAALYEAYNAGRASPLAPLPIQYADYALWQREWLQGTVLEEQLAYWRAQLAGAPTLFELPIARPRTPAPNDRGDRESFVFPPAVIGQLRVLSRQQNATLFMTLLAAFQVLLWRYVNQDDILVGTPIANRSQPEVEPLIGFFLNTLVIRGDLSGDPTFTQLLDNVREVCLSAYAHQDLPFEKLVEELEPERDLTRSPIFQVLFSLQTRSPVAARLPGLEIKAVDVTTESVKFDLSLSLIESKEKLTGWLNYSAHRFDAGAIARLIEHYQTLICGIIRDPQQRISELPLLTETEHQQLQAWNGKTVEYPGAGTFKDLFEAQAESTPEAIAVVHEETQLTYRELNRRANQLAHYLLTRGAGPEAVVAIYLERSVEMIVGVLGILKTGASYLPLDLAWPKERLKYVLGDSRAAHLLTREGLVSDLPGNGTLDNGTPVLKLDADWPAISKHGNDNPTSRGNLGNIAYVIYTSGSTGKPKGVVVEQRQLLNYMQGIKERIQYVPGDRIAMVQPLAVDASQTLLVTALCTGGSLHMISEARAADPAALADYMTSRRIDLLKIAPSHLAALQSGSRPEQILPRRCLIVAGEACPLEFARQVQQMAPDCAVFNHYGPTETTVAVVTHRFRPDESSEDFATLPIGRPLANVRAYVLDDRLQPVPVGIPGELHIGGAAVSRGYLNEPAMTAAKFIPDPFSAKPGERLYKSGDIVRYAPDGNLCFLGRADHQTKVRGYRVELGEIEAALRRHPSVREALVVVREDRPTDERLVAYLTATQASQSTADLRSYLHEGLPDYMVPQAYVWLERMPLTQHGKLDRQALPAPERTPVEHVPEHVQARTPSEEIVSEVFSEVLGIEAVGLHENFFELGGHSLLATKAISRLRDYLQAELPLRALFESPTVAELGAVIQGVLSQAKPEVRPPLGRATRGGSLPLSFAQQRLWLLNQLEFDAATYNIPKLLVLRGTLDLAALEQALNEIMSRHEVLRTAFPATAGEPYQLISAATLLPLPLVDLSELDEAERQRQSQELIATAAQQPFDLAQSPLLRVMVVRLSDHEHYLSLVLHHIIADGWSLSLLLRELAALYEAFSAGRGSTLASLPIQYADYALWQRDWLRGTVLEEQLAYWRSQLAGAPTLLELPIARPRPPAPSYSGDTVHRRFSVELSDDLKRLGRQERSTIFMLLVAVFKVLLWRYSGQEDVVVGTVLAGRTNREVEGLLGFFVNTLVLRTKISDDLSFREFLARVRETCLGAYAHQDLPFEKLVEELQPERNLSHAPLFQVMVTGHESQAGEQRFGDLQVKIGDPLYKQGKFDLSLAVGERAGQIECALQFSEELFDRGAIERLLGHYGELLRQVVAQPDTLLGEFTLLTAEEQQQILVAWNDTERPFPDRCLHELIEEQVERNPTALAVVSAGEQISYQELNQRSNRLGHYLRRLGVGIETPVGIWMDRSIEMIVAMLAVLKAGGSYVPLNATYPQERIQFMLDNAGVAVLLTQGRLHETVAVEHAQIICLDLQVEAIAGASAANLNTPISRDHLAYAMYTSGSTGTPKAVGCTHRGVINLLTDFARRAPLRAGVGFSCWTSLSFDVSVYEIFSALCAGGRLELPAEDVWPDTERFIRWLGERQIQSAYIPPFMLRELAASLNEGRGPLSLRRLLIGVEPIPERLLADISRSVPGLHVVNGYGPTEASVCATLYDVPPDQLDGDDHDGNTPIGKPVQNTAIYLLDNAMRPVPIGVPGELYIGGSGLARGYLRSGDLTAERFLPHPFSTEAGARLYRTGDLARYRADGTLEFLGRNDLQVKLRGYRIELQEVESRLRRRESVSEAVVLLREQEQRGAELVAFVELVEPKRATGEPQVSGEEAEPRREKELRISREFRAYLREQLPDYMVPSQIIWVERMPQTANGKIDRRALSALAQNSSAPNLESTEFTDREETPVEELVREIWQRVLGLERIGLEENFFDLGGHSLLAMQVVARVRESLKIDLSLRTLFELPTVAALARHLETTEDFASQVSPGRPAKQLRRISRDGKFPLSFNQESRLFRDWRQSMQSIPVRPFNVRLVYRVNGVLNAAALEQAINEIVRRHEVLRTTFTEMPGLLSNKLLAPILHRLLSMKSVLKRIRRLAKNTGVQSSAFSQQVVPGARLQLPQIDLRHLAETEREDEAHRLVLEELQRPFERSSSLRLRAVLVKLADEEHVMAVILDHLAADGWSIPVFMRELNGLYQTYSRGEPPSLPELPLQFGDFAQWEREEFQGEVLADMVSFWKEQFHAVGLMGEMELPFARPLRNPDYDYLGATETVTVPDSLCRALRELGNSKAVTTYMFQLATLMTLLFRYTAREHLGVWTALANRTQPETQALIGWLANIHILATDLSGDPTFSELLDRVRHRTLGTYAHQAIPYPLLFVSLLQQFENYRPPKNLYGVLAVNFLYAKEFAESQQLGELVLTPFEVKFQGVDFGRITFLVTERTDTMKIAVNYPPAVADAPDIQQMLTHYLELLENIVAAPEARLSQLTARLSPGHR
jgi:amino acid adenylation domain-containing protein